MDGSFPDGYEVLISTTGTALTTTSPIKLSTNANTPELVTVGTTSNIPSNSTVKGYYSSSSSHIDIPNINDASSEVSTIAYTGFLSNSYNVYNDLVYKDSAKFTDVDNALSAGKIIHLTVGANTEIVNKHLRLTNNSYGKYILFPLPIGLSLNTGDVLKYKLDINTVTNSSDKHHLTLTSDSGTSFVLNYSFPATNPFFIMSNRSYITAHNSMLMGREFKIVPSVDIPITFNSIMKMEYGNQNNGFIVNNNVSVLENEIMTFNSWRYTFYI